MSDIALVIGTLVAIAIIIPGVAFIGITIKVAVLKSRVKDSPKYWVNWSEPCGQCNAEGGYMRNPPGLSFPIYYTCSQCWGAKEITHRIPLSEALKAIL